MKIVEAYLIVDCETGIRCTVCLWEMKYRVGNKWVTKRFWF